MTPDQRLALLKLQDTLEGLLSDLGSILAKDNVPHAKVDSFNLLDWLAVNPGFHLRREDHHEFVSLVHAHTIESIEKIKTDLGMDASLVTIKYILSKPPEDRPKAIKEVFYLSMLKRWGINANVDTARQWFELLKTASGSKSVEDHGKALAWMVSHARKGGVPLSFPGQANPFIKAYREKMNEGSH